MHISTKGTRRVQSLWNIKRWEHRDLFPTNIQEQRADSDKRCCLVRTPSRRLCLFGCLESFVDVPAGSAAVVVGCSQSLPNDCNVKFMDRIVGGE